jgi:[acyl-carrier-protein] S-malonyltransferase
LGVQLTDVASFVAGHSLGEYSALCAGGSFDLSTTARLLKLRGQAMQQAVPVGQGAMAALLGADLALAQKVAEAAAQGEVCTVANDNDPSQVVISGHKGAIDRAIEIAKEMGAKRAIALPVSAPFHCPLMQPAAEAMRDALSYVVVEAPAVPLYANVTAQTETDPDTIRNQLVDQVTGMVRWRESVTNMTAAGVEEFVELGGKVLGPMVKRISPDAKVTSVVNIEDIEALAKEIA